MGSRSLLAALVVVGAMGCAASPPAQAPATSPERVAPPAEDRAAPGTSEIDTLEQDLARAEQTLRERLGERELVAVAETQSNEAQPRADEPKAQKPGRSETAPAGAPRPVDVAPAANKDDLARDKKKAEDSRQAGCELACRAMASMRRSADRICEILSNEHDRCTAARRRVSDAERRISDAKCQCTAEK
jgi:hypothetical protein